MKTQDFRPMFLAECADHLHTLSAFAEGLVRDGVDIASIDGAFRAIHSIKGGAGMFGLDRLVPVSHAIEGQFDEIRLSLKKVSNEHALAIVKCVDCLTDLIEAESSGFSLPAGFENLVIERLGHFTTVALAPGGVPGDDLAPSRAPTRRFHIRFSPGVGLLRRANEPLILFRELRDAGVARVTTGISRLPDIREMQPTDCYFTFDIDFSTDLERRDVAAIFEFVESDGELIITEVNESGDTVPDIIQESPSVAAVQSLLTADPEPEPPMRFTITDPEPAPAVATPAPDLKVTEPATSLIRVETEKIDKLVNLVGEIAIAQAQVTQLIDESLFNANPRLFQELSQLLLHTQALHDSVMSIRAQPVSTVFGRMTRLVRDLAEQLGKRIHLRVSGETTEIDKALVEQLSDPIVHMLRNAADHGLETPEERLAAGKPLEGIISLHAEQRGSRIVIEIADDGRGLNRRRIRELAVARGLIAAGADLAPEDVDNLIFLPGFSTSSTVTTLSGRGVGLDVVKQNVQRFGGRVSILSEPGKGCVVTLSLPLTLAVLEGMIIRCRSENYIIPVASILECKSDWKLQSREVPGAGPMLHYREKLVRLLELGQVFGLPGDTARDPVAILVDIEGRGVCALLADEILGQQQVVVKKLTGGLAGTKGVAGATILGNGQVALILDPAEIAVMARRGGSTPTSGAEWRAVA